MGISVYTKPFNSKNKSEKASVACLRLISVWSLWLGGSIGVGQSHLYTERSLMAPNSLIYY